MIYGQRSTTDLTPERVPRKMRGRAQPYRKRKPRQPGPTLDSILKGGPAYLQNPADFTRQRQRALKAFYGVGTGV